MTRVFIQRGSSNSSSSSGQNRSSLSGTGSNPSSSVPIQQQTTSIAHVSPAVKDEILSEAKEQSVVDASSESWGTADREHEVTGSQKISQMSMNIDETDNDKKTFGNAKVHNEDDAMSSGFLTKEFGRLTILEEETDTRVGGSFHFTSNAPPSSPLHPAKPLLTNSNSNSRRFVSVDPNAAWMGPSRRTTGFSGASNRSSPTGSHPSSPQSHCEGEGYNSADEQSSCFSSSYEEGKSEHQFEFDLIRVKGLEVQKMLEDGNCLFRAVADQVYGDSELYDLVRQMCIDYMERERDHFSQFLTEGFTKYCKRKRGDKVYGNNMEIQALSEMYNQPIHIYAYGTEPINIFHGSYNTDIPPIRLSYHYGNHYNSLVDPRRLAIGAGLGFSSLQGTNIDKDQVKAAIKAQQDQQIDNALFYSDLELTEKEIDRLVLVASRAEYDANDKLKRGLGQRESSTSTAEPSSSSTRSSLINRKAEAVSSVLSNSMQIMLSMGFSYLQVIEATSIFGDDVDSMVCYLIETGGGSRWKGKLTE